MERIKAELNRLDSIGQLRRIPQIEYKSDSCIRIDGVNYINFASNDYLGISTKQELVGEFLSKNIPKCFSSASARLLSGSSSEFTDLEKTIADMFGKEACLVFNTGYQCNLGVLSALCAKGDVIFSDKLNHASIIDGMRLSEGDFIRYKHLDYDNLETLLQAKRNKYKRALIVSESVFSMDGDIADIKKLIELKNKYNCLLMIDEAHAFCVYGESLGGITNGEDVDIITATFGKAVGSFGAFCVSYKEIIDYLINKSRSFIFSTSLPPINIAWSDWILNKKRDYVLSQKQKLDKLTNETHKILKNNGIYTSSVTQIIPIIIGDNDKTVKISEKLRSMGYYIPAIRPPTVPIGSSRLRLSLTADCNLYDIERLIKIIPKF